MNAILIIILVIAFIVMVGAIIFLYRDNKYQKNLREKEYPESEIKDSRKKVRPVLLSLVYYTIWVFLTVGAMTCFMMLMSHVFHFEKGLLIRIFTLAVGIVIFSRKQNLFVFFDKVLRIKVG